MEKIKEEMESARPKLMVMMEPMVVGSGLYTFRSLSSSELKEYHKFKISDFGKKYSEVLTGAFSKAMMDGMARYLNSIKWAVENDKLNKGKTSDT